MRRRATDRAQIISKAEGRKRKAEGKKPRSEVGGQRSEFRRSAEFIPLRRPTALV